MAAIDLTADSTYDICWGRGDTDPKTFTITDSDGVVIDISTWDVITLTVNIDKEPIGIGNQDFAVTGAFVTDGTDGQVIFTPAVDDTDITIGKHYYDIQRSISGVNLRTLFKATCIIVQDVSKGIA